MNRIICIGSSTVIGAALGYIYARYHQPTMPSYAVEGFDWWGAAGSMLAYAVMGFFAGWLIWRKRPTN